MRYQTVAAVFIALFIAQLTAPTAGAHQVTPYEYETSFDGSGSTAGPFSNQVGGIAIDQSTGKLYVADGTESFCPESESPYVGMSRDGTIVSKFDASGHPVAFEGVAPASTICAVPAEYAGYWLPSGAPVSVDNSGNGEGLFVPNGDLFGYTLGGLLKSPYPTEISAFANGQLEMVRDSAVAPSGYLWIMANGIHRIDPATGMFDKPKREYFPSTYAHSATKSLGIDGEGYFYIANNAEPGVTKFGRESEFTYDSSGLEGTSPVVGHFGSKPVMDIAVDPSNNHVYLLEEAGFGEWQVTEYTSEGAKIQTVPLSGSSWLQEPHGIAVSASTHDLYVAARSGVETGAVNIYKPGPPVTAADAVTLPAEPTPSSATLRGTVNADGVPTTECFFEWGEDTRYAGGTVPCAEGNVFEGSGDEAVSVHLSNLTKGQRYHYRLVVENGSGVAGYGVDRSFEASGPPIPKPPAVVTEVNTDSARFELEIDPNGGTTTYWLEYGSEDCSASLCSRFPVAPLELGSSNLNVQTASVLLRGLTPGTRYHFRFIAQNGAGSTPSPDQIFSTYPRNPTSDPCPNVQVRQQTGASLLLDCRAYELASAENAGGYDVEPNAVPGQQPLEAAPEADGLLYSLHYGSIPGVAGDPTNYGRDPYVATRGENGWTTRYVGIPATAGQGISKPFGSPLAGSDSGLTTFAFSGAELCSPCFPDGSRGIPIHMPDGSLVQGMVGSLHPTGPAAEPAGFIEKPLSADGTHFVFGSTGQYEPAGNDNGDVTVYERDLAAGVTEVASTTPGGATMTGSGIGELAISRNGSRVLVAQRLSSDGAGNDRYHLYMHFAGSSASADLTPGAGEGVLFDGMTSDGSRVFFTTSDRILPSEDTDESADIYEAKVTSPTSVQLRLVSSGSGGSGNGEECEPLGSPNTWNAAEGDGKCGALAFAGGGGLAADEGTFYFLSPELLDGSGNGTEGLPNLYVVKPDGSPHFVRTIDSATGKAPQGPPVNPLIDANFAGAHSGPEALAVDQASENVYVLEREGGRVARFTSGGAAANFSALGGTNKITGLTLNHPSKAQVAVDNSGGTFDGDFYVTSGTTVNVYEPSGEEIGRITGSGTTFGWGFGEPCGVTVDPNGVVYIAGTMSYGYGVIWQYTPSAGTTPVSDSDYTVKGWVFPEFKPCSLAADSLGHVYAASAENGPTKKLEASEFAYYKFTEGGAQVDEGGKALYVDPSTDNLWVDEGNKLAVRDSSGQLVKTAAVGEIQGSRGVAVIGATERVYASGVSNVSEFGSAPAPYEPIDNPAIVHAVRSAGTRDTADIQVTPDGRYAALTSVLPLTGFPVRGHSEIYRYDSTPGEEGLICASCAPTNAAATTDTFLTSGGLNLTDAGAVFFTSREGLVLRDTNRQADAYEWENGNTQLISTGSATTAATLLSATSNGVDAFFFTRQKLVPQDQNGNTMKIYDARKNGGFLFIPGEKPCAAADECHGPGSPVPPPPPINTVTGQGATTPVAHKKKKGRHKHPHHHLHHQHRRRQGSRHGGQKTHTATGRHG